MNRLLYLHAALLIARIRRSYYNAGLALKMLGHGLWVFPLGLRIGYRENGISGALRCVRVALTICTSSAWDTFMNRPLRLVNACRLAELRGEQPPL